MDRFDDSTDLNLGELDLAAWRDRLEELCDDHGHFDPLGPEASALQIDGGRQLLVSFETVPGVRKFNPGAAPLGWRMNREYGWSSLTLLGNPADYWFRHRAIYGYFDRLIDDGFFDDFDQVLFYGAGGAGYAAAAYSVAAPDCSVLALRPQATLDPALAPWDRRHLSQRRNDFTSRFGYAPMMLETAARAWIVHDPMVPEDSMHASLFKADNTLVLETPNLGPAIERDLATMGVLEDLLDEAMEGTLDQSSFAGYWRDRQQHLPYLRSLFQRLDAAGREDHLARLCRYVLRDGNRPMFARRLAEIEARTAAATDAPVTAEAEDA